MDANDPIRSEDEWSFPFRIKNGLKQRDDIVFDIKVGETDLQSFSIKLVVLKRHDDSDRGKWTDEHEFDTYLNVQALPFSRLFDMGSFIRWYSDTTDLLHNVVERTIASMLEQGDSHFVVTDSTLEPSGSAEEGRQLIFTLKLNRVYSGEICLPWHYASKYFVVPK